MAPHPVNVLSLCSGVGGLELGLRLAVGPAVRTVCWVEREAYNAAVLAQRAEDGAIHPAPVWSDLRTFDPEPWRGVVDLVTAGFPCQPFSHAGKRGGDQDERHLWPHVLRVLTGSGAPVLFCENVRGLVSKGLRQVLSDLAGVGFDAEWDVFSAEEEGAPHIRERLFLLAHASGVQLRAQPWRVCWEGRAGQVEPGDHGQAESLAYADSRRRQGVGLPEPRGQQSTRGREPLRRGSVREQQDAKEVGEANRARPQGWQPEQEGRLAGPAHPGWWATEPSLGRVAHGVANRVDRLRATGNGVVPAVAARAFSELALRAWGDA